MGSSPPARSACTEKYIQLICAPLSLTKRGYNSCGVAPMHARALDRIDYRDVTEGDFTTFSTRAVDPYSCTAYLALRSEVKL